jgi:hypothetical protein
MWDNSVQLGQAADDSMAHAHCMLGTYCYNHTLKICNTKVPQCDVTRTLPALLLRARYLGLKILCPNWF